MQVCYINIKHCVKIQKVSGHAPSKYNYNLLGPKFVLRHSAENLVNTVSFMEAEHGEVIYVNMTAFTSNACLFFFWLELIKFYCFFI